MSDITTRNAYGFSLASLLGDGERFVGALAHPVHGPQVREFMPDGFADTYSATLERLAALNADHATACGAVHLAAQRQAEAKADVVALSSPAREAARAAYNRNTPLLHDEFLIGVQGPGDLASFISRAELLVAACRNHADALAPQGWVPRKTEALAVAVAKLAAAKLRMHQAVALKERLTGEKNATANEFFRQSRALQRAVRAVFQRKPDDSSTIEPRALFLVGEFPTRNRAARRANSAPAPETTPAEPAPAAQPPAPASTSPMPMASSDVIASPVALLGRAGPLTEPTLLPLVRPRPIPSHVP